jgi:hypothetical protein
MSTSADSPQSGLPDAARPGFSRAAWHALGVALAVLLAYASWRGYQNPDLLLDLSALRIC